ncbi:hypothetical protein [Brevibacillus agri]|uniref:hypothetical protein n=2 Tax=Brevibacillus agri TaxID=51101 RepID=UPI003D24CB2C
MMDAIVDENRPPDGVAFVEAPFLRAVFAKAAGFIKDSVKRTNASSRPFAVNCPLSSLRGIFYENGSLFAKLEQGAATVFRA